MALSDGDAWAIEFIAINSHFDVVRKCSIATTRNVENVESTQALRFISMWGKNICTGMTKTGGRGFDHNDINFTFK